MSPLLSILLVAAQMSEAAPARGGPLRDEAAWTAIAVFLLWMWLAILVCTRLLWLLAREADRAHELGLHEDDAAPDVTADAADLPTPAS